MLNKISHFFTSKLPSTILSFSAQYITFQVNKVNNNNRKKDGRKKRNFSITLKHLYYLYLLYISFMVVRVAVASLVLHRILSFTFNSPEEYFSSVDILIGHLFKLGVLNRNLGLVCAPFTLLVLFDYWFYFGGDGNNSTYRLLYDLVVLNKRNFFQLNPQLGGWTGLAKMKFQNWWFTKKDAQKRKQKMKLTVTTTPLTILSTLPTSIRLQAALFSLTADLLTMLLFAYFSLITAIFQPHSFLQTEYLGGLPLRLLIFFEVFFVTTVSLYNSLLSLLIGHFLSLVVFVLKRLQAAATAQLKLRIELTKRRRRRQGAKNHSLAAFLRSAYLPLHNRVVIHFTRANEQLFSRALFYFISAVLVVNIYVVTQLMFEEEKLSADMKLHLVVGCLYQLSVFVFALRPMVAAQRVMVAAGRQHFRSQVYLPSGSGSLSLRLKLSAITTVDNRKLFVFAFTLGPLGCVTAKFIMEVMLIANFFNLNFFKLFLILHLTASNIVHCVSSFFIQLDARRKWSYEVKNVLNFKNAQNCLFHFN